ncbi:MAG: hypothetical protein D8B54_02230 [Catonella sp.]|nr:MAG: hypothetical protein D8B54_02230 [Catonella sp.]
MNITFLESIPIFGHLITILITFYPFTIFMWLFSWRVIVRYLFKAYRNTKRRKAGIADGDLETTNPQVGWAMLCVFVFSLGIGTYKIVWQGTPDQVEVYSSFLLEKSTHQVIIHQNNYHLPENYTVQELHQTDDMYHHPDTGAQGAITSVKHGPLNDDLVQLTYTINDTSHQAVVKMSRNEYSALFTHVLNEPLPISVVDNKVIVDTYYQTATTPEVAINYQIGGEKSMLMDLIKIVLALGILIWIGMIAATACLILVSALTAPEDLIKICLLTCAFFIGTFVVAPHVPLLSGPWVKDDRQASLLVTQNGHVTYYQPDYDIGEVTRPGRLYLGKDTPEVMWGSKVTIVDMKHGEPGSNMVRLTYQTPTERNHIYVKMTDDQFQYLYRRLYLGVKATISNGDVILQP